MIDVRKSHGKISPDLIRAFAISIAYICFREHLLTIRRILFLSRMLMKRLVYLFVLFSQCTYLHK